MEYAVKMAWCSTTYVRSFMKTGTGVQAQLRVRFRNLRDCSVFITHGRVLRITPLRRTQIPRFL
jgi:hypothetical protein